MRIIIVTAIMLLNLWIQSTILSFIEVGGIIPNTSFILIVCYGRLRGDIEGGLFGFVSGLFMDVYFGRIIGMYALLGFFTGFLCGKPFRDYYRRNFVTLIFFIGIVTFFYEFVFYVMNYLFMGKLDLFFFIRTIIAPLCVYNMVASVIIYPLFYYINKIIETYEKPKRKMFNDLGGYNGSIK